VLGLGLAAAGASEVLNGIQLARRRPRLNNARRAVNRLDQGFEQRVDQIAPGRSKEYEIAWNAPRENMSAFERLNDMRDTNKYASSSAAGEVPGIDINPHADRVYLAHEMGHLASQKTDIGHLVASLRANPKLKTALLGAMLTVPGVAAALEPGDDDMDTSIAMAALTSAPAITDEILASKNGLAIMENAGMRASLGQRGKLAGALLSYLAAPIIAGSAGNMVGNLVDSDPSGL